MDELSEGRKQELWAQYQAAISEGTAGVLWDELTTEEHVFIITYRAQLLFELLNTAMQEFAKQVEPIWKTITEWCENVYRAVIEALAPTFRWYRWITNRAYRVPANVWRKVIHAQPYPLVLWYPALE